MHKNIYLCIFFPIKTMENKNNTVSIPISMPSFIRLLIRHKMLHFMRAEGLNAWRTVLLCEWERTLGEAMCDISVRELITTCEVTPAWCVMIDMSLVSSMWATKWLESWAETSFHPRNKYFLTTSQVRSIKVSLFIATVCSTVYSCSTATYSQKINDMWRKVSFSRSK